jgi:hypothetical protein
MRATTTRTPNSSSPIEPLAVKTKTAWAMLDCSNAHGWELINRGELESYKEGRIRKVVVASIHRYIERKLAAAKETGPARTEKATAVRIAKRRARKALEDGTSPQPANTSQKQPEAE